MWQLSGKAWESGQPGACRHMCPGPEPQSSPGAPQGFIIKYKVKAVRSGKQNRGLSSVAERGSCWLRDPDLTERQD